MTNHRFIADDLPETERDTDRKVMLSLGNGEVATMLAERDEPMLSPPVNPSLRPFNAPITWHEGRALRHLGMEETQRFIPIVEQRLELNARLLAQYAEAIPAQTAITEQNSMLLQRARDRAWQVVWADREWMERANSQWKPGGDNLITQGMEYFGGDRWLSSKQCYLRDTPEFRRLDLLEARAKDPSSTECQAIRELSRLETALAEERNLTTLLTARLAQLQENLAWWQRELSELSAA